MTLNIPCPTISRIPAASPSDWQFLHAYTDATTIIARGCRSARCASLNPDVLFPIYTLFRIYAISTAQRLLRTLPLAILKPTWIMRLLQCNNNGNLSLTEFLESAIPQYAILSHKWGVEEVAFKDLLDGKSKSKAGYDKIQFCGEQASRDGLQYFWVDTCCIDKSNNTELVEAINSMFRWYQKAARCYVYLSDVSTRKRKASNTSTECTWESAFRNSEWFTRGWTLQELLAPRLVEFFSQEGKRLGDKGTLKRQIQGITGIPISALEGAPLSQFRVEERLSWAENRQTTREEDKAYSLLGIFGIHLPLIYGEGKEHAFKRLKKEIQSSLLENEQNIFNPQNRNCIQDLRTTDPRVDKKRIEDAKGGLLRDSYQWIFEHSDFKQWRDDKHSRLLWIKGDPGKGKTMLICGILDEISSLTRLRDKEAATLLSYFFCQATDSRINNAVAVLRGLIYLLVDQQPSLLSRVREKYDHAGKALFEDANAWITLSEIFSSILQDLGLNSTCLIIDALDECVADLPKLLDFIVQTSFISPRIKWVISSRNWPDIEERLERAGHKMILCLELNPKSVSAAVSTYIKHKTLQLADQKQYDNRTREAVLQHLVSNANDTFLWVALVCENLSNVPRWKTLTKLSEFPPGLNSLYQRMLSQIYNSDDADLCKQILAIISTVYRPITLAEISSVVKMLEDKADDHESLVAIIGLCGSFLALRQGTISFIHQSAKDFLVKEASGDLFPSGIEDEHYTIFSQSLHIMSKTLRRDIYSLGAPGISIDQFETPEPDPLAAARYSCVHWVNHLLDCVSKENTINDLEDGSLIYKFLCQSFLYWLEALSLMGSLSDGILMIRKLENLQTSESPDLHAFIRDARRFAIYNQSVIEQAPLQLYCSALIFAPERSIVRRQFEGYIPTWIQRKPKVQADWSAALQTLEGHSSDVNSVAFSHDSKYLVSASDDKSVMIWDAATGKCLQILKGHSSNVNSIAFSHDSKQVASVSDDRTVKIWDTATGKCLESLESHSGDVNSIAFSQGSKQVVSASADKTIKIWGIATKIYPQTLEGHSDCVRSVAFSHNSKQVVSASDDRTIKIWDTATGIYLQTLEGHSDCVRSIAFSHDSSQIVSASDDRTVKIWDTATGRCQRTLEGHKDWVRSVAFSYDSSQIASASNDQTIKIWDTVTGRCLQTLEGHSNEVNSIVFSHDSKQVVSASADHTIKLWDITTGQYLQISEDHNNRVNSIVFLYNSRQIISASDDQTIKTWDTSTGKCLQTFDGHRKEVNSIALSHNSKQIISASDDRTVKIWDITTGICLQTLKGHNDCVSSVAFSHDSSQIVSASDDQTAKIWDTATGECQQDLVGHSDWVSSVAFSHDSKQVASASKDQTIKIWDVATGIYLQTLEGHSDCVRSVAFSHNSSQIISASDDRTAKIWDIATGQCLQTFDTSETLWNISFDTADQHLYTEIGAIYLDLANLLTLNTALPITSQMSLRKGYGLSSNGKWIIWNSECLLWLPSEYRPSISAVMGSTIAIGCESGRVFFLNFSVEHVNAIKFCHGGKPKS